MKSSASMGLSCGAEINKAAVGCEPQRKNKRK